MCTQPPKSISVGDTWESSWESCYEWCMGGASMKYSRSASVHNIETTPPQLDNIQRIYSMLDKCPYLCVFKLQREPAHEYMLHKSCVMQFLKGDDWVDIPIIQ